MDGRAFLPIARELLQGADEPHWRAATGRAYYALMLECRAALERWGFAAPPRVQVHTFVRLRFTYAADPDLKEVGYALEWLSDMRNRADYAVASAGSFADAQVATKAIARAEQNIARVDQIEADPAHRAAAVAGIRRAFP